MSRDNFSDEIPEYPVVTENLIIELLHRPKWNLLEKLLIEAGNQATWREEPVRETKE